MSLYKYVSSERLDIVRNLRIRFTQPSAQNDPFEFRPIVDRFRRPSMASEQLSKEWDLRFPEALDRANPRLKAFITGRPALLASVKEIRLAEADAQSDKTARDELFARLDSGIGILSLSEVPDSFTMWCRYASGHTGFVLEFDDRHQWFSARAQEKDDTHELRKVSYVDVPSSPYLAELDVHEVLYSKRKAWACEKEWRIIRPLVESAEQKGQDIHLFAVPPTALTGVIIGSQTIDNHVNELLSVIDGNRDLTHLRLGMADCDPCEQTVDVFWIGSQADIRAKLRRVPKTT